MRSWFFFGWRGWDFFFSDSAVPVRVRNSPDEAKEYILGVVYRRYRATAPADSINEKGCGFIDSLVHSARHIATPQVDTPRSLIRQPRKHVPETRMRTKTPVSGPAEHLQYLAPQSTP